MGGFVSLWVVFVIGEAVLLLSLIVATEGGISCVCLNKIEMLLFSPSNTLPINLRGGTTTIHDGLQFNLL